MVRRRVNTFGEAWEIQQWRDSWINALCLPLDLRLKTEVCAIGLYKAAFRGIERALAEHGYNNRVQLVRAFDFVDAVNERYQFEP